MKSFYENNKFNTDIPKKTIWFQEYKNIEITQKIAMTSVFLTFIIIFQFLSKYSLYFDTFLKLNLSLVFILPIFFFTGPIFGVGSLIFRFLIGPLVGEHTYNMEGVVSNAILLLSASIIILFLYMYSWIFNDIKKYYVKYLTIVILTILSGTLIISVANGILFTPIFILTLHNGTHNIYLSTAKHYYGDHTFMISHHFGIKNYWSGIFAVYTSGNIVKYSSIFILTFPLILIIEKYSFWSND